MPYCLNDLKYFAYHHSIGPCYVAATDIIKAVDTIKKTTLLHDISLDNISMRSFPLPSVRYTLDTYPWDVRVCLERALDGNIIAFCDGIMVHRLEDIDPSLVYSEHEIDIAVSFCPMYDYFKLHDLFKGHKLAVRYDKVYVDSEASLMEIMLKQ